MQLRIESNDLFNHNKSMKAYFLTLFLCAAYLLVGLNSSAQGQNEEDFNIRKRNLEDRFEDYYTRQILLERAALEREKGSDEMIVQRRRLAEEQERNRQQFVLERAKKIEGDNTLHEKEIAERKKEYEKNREEFVRRMQSLKQIEKDLVIPGEEELGISLERENL